MMDKKFPRRALLKGALAGLAAIPIVAIATRAEAAAAKVDPNDAQAKSLGYIVDTTKVDAKANPMHKPEQKCSSCVQYQGKATDAAAPCTIFAGKLVEGNGWCKVWAKKP
jgi:hypothetical protein